jgi:hypothetical protein
MHRTKNYPLEFLVRYQIYKLGRLHPFKNVTGCNYNNKPALSAAEYKVLLSKKNIQFITMSGNKIKNIAIENEVEEVEVIQP